MDFKDRIEERSEKESVQIGWIRDIYPIRATAEAALVRGDLFVEEWDRRIVGTAIINQIQVDACENASWQYDVYKEIGILPCVFNGIPDVNLVMLEKKVGL